MKYKLDSNGNRLPSKLYLYYYNTVLKDIGSERVHKLAAANKQRYERALHVIKSDRHMYLYQCECISGLKKLLYYDTIHECIYENQCRIIDSLLEKDGSSYSSAQFYNILSFANTGLGILNGCKDEHYIDEDFITRYTTTIINSMNQYGKFLWKDTKAKVGGTWWRTESLCIVAGRDPLDTAGYRDLAKFELDRFHKNNPDTKLKYEYRIWHLVNLNKLQYGFTRAYYILLMNWALSSIDFHQLSSEDWTELSDYAAHMKKDIKICSSHYLIRLSYMQFKDDLKRYKKRFIYF